MLSKPTYLEVDKSTNEIYQIIQSETEKDLLNKKYNLSGNRSENGGLDLYPKITFAAFTPSLGPFVEINLKAVSIDRNGKRSKITISRINGSTYKYHFSFALLFTLLAVIVMVAHLSSENQESNYAVFLVPAIGIFYIILLEIVADITRYNITNRIEKILQKSNVRIKKL